MLNEEAFVNKFVSIFYNDLMATLKERKEKLTDKLISTEKFKNWFNENWIADLWIDYVDMTVDNMNTGEKTELLVDYGLDNAFELCRLIGVFEDEDNICTHKLTWHIIDHWYSYDYVIEKFKKMYDSEIKTKPKPKPVTKSKLKK